MATLNISNVTSTGFNWYVSGLGSPWNYNYYQRIVICTGTTSQGSATAPSGVLGSIYPPTSGSNTYTPTHSVSGLTESRTYTLYAYTLAKNGSWYFVQSQTITTPAKPKPIPSTPKWYDYGVSSPTQIHLSWLAVSSATYYEVYNGTTNEIRRYTTTYAYWNNLLPNKNYGFCVRAGNDNGVSAWSDYVWIKTPLQRPANWTWTSTIASGSSFNISATEWNSFTARINAFRQYKGLSVYGFTSATSGSPFYAYMFNQAITAIKEMSPPSGVGVSTQSSGNTIYAWYFTNLKESLNSIK